MLRLLKDLLPWKVRLWLHLFFVKYPQFYINGIRQKKNTLQQTIRILEKHMHSMGVSDFKGKTVCELGPGDSLYHGVMAYQLGARQMYMLDIADLAGSEAKFDILDIQLKRPMPECIKGETWKSYLKKLDVEYLTEGIESYYKVPDGAVDILFSNVVLEHVRLDIFEETVKQMNRMCKMGALCSHIVDYKDHLGGGLNALRVPTEKWESSLYKKMPNYVNRILYYDMIDIFKKNGFALIGEPKFQLREKIPVARSKLIPEYRNKSGKELRIAMAGFVLEKVR